MDSSSFVVKQYSGVGSSLDGQNIDHPVVGPA